MARKKKLSSLQSVKPMVPAEVWFRNNSELPVNTVRGTEGKPRKAQKVEETPLSEPIPAAIWFKNQDQLPNNTKEIVRPVVQAPPVKETQREADAVREQTEEKQVTDQTHDDLEHLITSILSLTKTIEKERLDRIRGEEIDKDEGKKKYKSFKDLVKSVTGEKVERFKDKTSLRNVLFMSGMRSAFRGSDTILDALLTYREDKKKEKAEKPSVLSAVASGTGEYLKNKIANAVEPIREKFVDKVGKPLTNNPITNYVKTKFDNTAKKPIFSPKKALRIAAKTAAISKPNTLFGTIARNYYPEINNDPELMVSRLLNQPNTPGDKKFTQEVRSGMRDELVKLSESQLDQLKKIVGALTESQEQDLEKKDEKPSPIVEAKKIDDKKDEKSLISSLMEGIGSFKTILSEGIGTLSKVIGPLLRFAVPALGVGAAGVAGYAAGNLLNEKVINPAAEAITGVQGATLGTALYDAVDNVKGWFGESDADKFNKASKSRVSSGKIKNQIEPVPYRPNLTAKVKAGVTESDKSKSKASNTVVDASTKVVNNSNSVNYIRPKVRNDDNTFNNLLSRNFSH